MTNNSTTPLDMNKKRSSRGMAYLWIGMAAGFVFLTALYVGFVR